MKTSNLLLLLLTLWLSGCQNSQNSSKEVSFSKPGNAPYVIKDVRPAGAMPGTTITISGDKFPEKGLEVYFDDVLVDSLESVSALSLSVKVPRVKNPGQVRLQLRTRGQDSASNTVPFSVDAVPNDLPTIYFTTHKLYRGAVSEQGIVEIDEIEDIGFPRGLKVDKDKNEFIYASYYGQIYRKIGDAKPVLIKQFPEGLEGMIIDSKNEWMYVATASTISRMSLLDTTKIELLYKNRQHPKSLRINEKANELIWIELDPLHIIASSLDGKSEPKIIFDKDSGLTGPTCIEIDLANQKIYVGDVSAFGNSRIMEGDLQKNGPLDILLTSKDGIGENVIDLKLDKKYLYVMNSKGINQDILEDGGIVRIPIAETEKKPQIVMQPIHHGYLIAL